MVRSYDLHANAYITKPVDMEPVRARWSRGSTTSSSRVVKLAP